MRISEAESRVMDVLWEKAPSTAEEIAAALAGREDWQEATIKTLLNRLLKKGALAAERDGRRYLYRPLVQRADYVHEESRSLLDRLYGGQVSALVAHFSRSKALSRQEIDEIRALIEEIDRGH